MSIFSQTSSIFNQPSQQQNPNTSSTPFPPANTNQSQKKPDLFGSLNLQTGTSQPQQSSGLFGPVTSQPAQSGGLFASTQPASTGGLFASSTSQPQQSGGLFGSINQSQSAGGLSGSTQQQKPGGLFGSTTQSQPSSNVFGQPQSQQQNATQSTGLFGNLGQSSQQPQQQPQQQAGNSIFGSLGQSTQQSQQQPQQGSVLAQSQGQSRLFQDSEIAPRMLISSLPLLSP